MAKRARVVGRPFRKGVSGNPSGRPRIVREIKDMCRMRGPEAVKLLFEIAHDETQSTFGRVVALKTALAYAYGNPVSATALHVLDHRQGNADGGEVTIAVGFGKAPAPLDAYASAVPEPAPPGARQIEDLRAPVVAEKREALEARLAAVNAEIERLTRLEAERTSVPAELRRGWTFDPPSRGGGDWPGRSG